MTKEKRIQQRAPVILPAMYSVENRPDEANISSTINISPKGLCINSRRMLKVGIKLSIAVKTDQGEEIVVATETRWCKKMGDKNEFMVGLRILSVTDKHFEKFLVLYTSKVSALHEEVN